jgi:hypothetical protein
VLTRESKKTPKGTAPSPMRRGTKHKRVWFGVQLEEAKRKRDWRRYQGKEGDSNARE